MMKMKEVGTSDDKKVQVMMTIAPCQVISLHVAQGVRRGFDPWAADGSQAGNWRPGVSSRDEAPGWDQRWSGGKRK